jgi:hypothetical protein
MLEILVNLGVYFKIDLEDERFDLGQCNILYSCNQLFLECPKKKYH